LRWIAKGRRAALLAGCGLCFSACLSEEPSVLPLVPGVRSFALIHNVEEAPTVFTFDVEDPESLSVRLDAEVEGPLHIALFSSPLVDLGLPAGRLSIAEPGELAYPLPTALRALEGQRLDGRLEWEATASAEVEVARTWLVGEPTRTRACPEITVRSFRLPLGPEPKRWISVAEHLGDGRVLVGTERGEFLSVTRDGVERVRSLTASVAHGASFRDTSGQIWLAQCENDGLFTVSSDLRVDRSISTRCGSWTSAPEFIVRMDGAPPGAPNELVTMSRGGRVVLWDEARRGTELYNVGAQVLLQFVSWDEPGRAALTLVEPEYISLQGPNQSERIRPDWKPRGDPPKFYRARRLPTGLALAGEDGQGRGIVMLREEAGQTWYILGETGIVGPTYQIVPTADGFAYAGGTRQMGWWTKETGFCPAANLGPPGADGRPTWELGSFSFYIVVPVSEDEMFVGGFVTLSETSEYVWWVRRQR
jgi:hypothetical protein